MKSFFASLLLLFGSIISLNSMAQGSLANLDAKNGFKGAVFGSDISRYPNLVLSTFMLSEYNSFIVDRLDKDMYLNNKVYVNKGTSKIGDLNIGKINYYFTRNKLLRIDFQPERYEGFELLKLYRNLYGSPKIEKGDGPTTYEWKGKKVNLSMTFSESFNNNPSFWFVRYISISAVSKSKSDVNRARANDL